MNLFDKELGQADQEDIRGRLDNLEQYVNYLREQMEYWTRQIEKKLEGGA